MSQAPVSPARSAASRLFDIRLVIGSLFVIYGAMLTIAGLGASSSQRVKSAGININLWMGLAMLVTGLLFLLWMRLNPLHPPQHDPVAPGGRGSDETTS